MRIFSLKKSVLLLLGGTFAWLLPAVASAQFKNPIPNSTSLSEIIRDVSYWLTGLVVVLATMAVIWGGIRLIIGVGREQEIQKAKTIILWGIIGLAVAFLVWVFLCTIMELLNVGCLSYTLGEGSS